MDELLHGVRVVIDALEEHALIAERDAAVRKASQGLTHLAGQFTRVVHMHTHPQGMILAEHRAEFGSDALREENRDARADSKKFEVRNRSQTLKNRFQARV